VLKCGAAYVVTFSLLFAGIANAKDSPFSVYAVTGLSCGKYIQDIARDPMKEIVYHWWVDGFLTGTNMEKGRVTSSDSAAHDAWLKKYCQENPLDHFINAANKLNKELDRQ